MTFEANLAFGSIFPVVRLPVSGVWSNAATLVTLYAYIPFRVAAGTGLQVATGFRGMLGNSCRRVPLCIKTKVRLYSHATFGESVVTLIALFLLVATKAALRIIGSLDRVDAYEVASVTAWCKITARAFSFEIGTDPATLVTVEAVCLSVALSTVVCRLACNSSMVSDPVTVMIGGDTFAFMAGVAFTNSCFTVLLVTLFLGCCLLNIKDRQDKKHDNEHLILHRYTPFLKVVVKYQPSRIILGKVNIDIVLDSSG